jgi:glyoxylase-like metal-dependent hydrolase (beta-lactamase superfamily II)
VEQVQPGLWSIPVFWPRSALRYTLAYLLEYRGGVALVDTGWPTDEGLATLTEGVEQTGHDLADISHVLVTHAHPDHLGMADHVRRASGARVGMHPADTAILGSAGSPQWRDRFMGWLRSRGTPGGEASALMEVMTVAAKRHALLSRPDLDIEDGDVPLGSGSALRAIWTPGHSPGHLCFYDQERNVLLTGDHVLPRITPHIGLSMGMDGDPLSDYQASLRTLTRYDPADVLPAHEYRFADLGARVEELLRHHQIRLAEIEHVVASEPGLSTWAVASVLTWSRGWERTRGEARHAAVTETLAHLVHLKEHGRVIDVGTGSDRWLPGPRCSATD